VLCHPPCSRRPRRARNRPGTPFRYSFASCKSSMETIYSDIRKQSNKSFPSCAYSPRWCYPNRHGRSRNTGTVTSMNTKPERPVAGMTYRVSREMRSCSTGHRDMGGVLQAGTNAILCLVWVIRWDETHIYPTYEETLVCAQRRPKEGLTLDGIRRLAEG
jgi:hypothetical protein